MKKLLFLISGLVALQGCGVGFERQTIVYRHDTERDELRMLMVYEGIYGDKADDYEELRSVLLRPRTFFFSNWGLEYDRDAWVQAQQNAGSKQDTAPTLASRRLISLTLDNVRVENGAFYLNNAGKLSGYQRVTLSNVSELVSAFNEMVNTGFIHGELRLTDIPLASSASAGTIKNAAYAGHRWIELDEGELRMRIPLASGDYEQFRREVKDDSDWQKFTEAGMREFYAAGVFEFAFGEYWHSHTTISMDVFDGPYVPNLLPFVEEEGLLEPSPDFDAIVRRFVKRK